MQNSQASLTALITAFARAYHSTHDKPPIFDDFIADRLFTDEEKSFFGHSLAQALSFFDPELAASCPDEKTALARVMRLQSAPISLSRMRYGEDALEAAVKRGVQQYVILGAGLETFAFRRPDLLGQIQVFEVDHPATQESKLQRLAGLGWKIPPELHFVPMDFTRDSLSEALRKSPFDFKTLSFFSWLGVTYYLPTEAVEATLRAIAGIAPSGSSLVFDYMDPDAFIPEKASPRAQRVQEIVRRAGEPMQGGFDPVTLADFLDRCGFILKENLDPGHIEERFFKGRTDGYHAFEHVHFAYAVVR